MSLVIVGIGAAAALYWALKKRRYSCVDSHSEHGLNYPWLRGVHGGLGYILYEEPAGSGKWLPYTDQVWGIHCRVISHNPADLVEKHMAAFVNPGRFARLMFYFNDGTAMEPTRQFYEAEAAWFKKHGKY